MYGFGFDINIAAIKLKTFVIFKPAQRSVAMLDFQRGAEDGFIRHFGVVHIDRQPAVFHATFQFAAEVFCAWQQFPLLPGKVFPCGLEARFLRRLKRDVQPQGVDRPARLRGQPDLTKVRREFCGHRAQPFDGGQIQIAGSNT